MNGSDHAQFQSAELADMLAKAQAEGGYAAKVVRSPLLSVGLYVLAAGGVDNQKPHLEDEVYYVVRGRARFAAGTVDHQVEPGSLLFVEATVPHRFHDITEELVLVVFWAPPEKSVGAGI
jgi:mannose-6-phosphate isomerase-like protein (cupin superfamily)